MDIAIKISDNIARVTVNGAVDTLDSDRLMETLEGLPDDAHGIELDFDGVDYISSAGLRVLLRALDIAAERGGEMKIVKCSGFVREILAAVGFNKLFSVD